MTVYSTFIVCVDLQHHILLEQSIYQSINQSFNGKKTSSCRELQLELHRNEVNYIIIIIVEDRRTSVIALLLLSWQPVND